MTYVGHDGSGWSPLLDQLKEKERLKSDAALARLLGVTRSFISAVRANRKNISPELGEKIFELLGKQVSKEDIEIFKPLRLQMIGRGRRTNFQARASVLARSKGFCELCGSAAPFLTLGGEPYLEIHHIFPISSGGAEGVESLVALCPNCHRKVEMRPSEDDAKILLAKAQKSRCVD